MRFCWKSNGVEWKLGSDWRPDSQPICANLIGAEHVGYSVAFVLLSESIGSEHSSQSPEEALPPDTTHSLELGTENHSLNHREAAAGCGGLAKTLSLESCSDFVMLRRRIR